MRTSEQTADLMAALAKAQAGLKNASLNKVNPHFRSKYADLAGIRDTVTPVLSAHGLSVVQGPDVTDDGRAVLVTRLSHASGQWIESVCPLPVAPDMQKMGSALTYARRYGLSAIVCIAADEDDDANEATTAPAIPATCCDDWLDDMTAEAQEGRYGQHWAKLSADKRKHIQNAHGARHEALKATSAKAKGAAA